MGLISQFQCRHPNCAYRIIVHAPRQFGNHFQNKFALCIRPRQPRHHAVIERTHGFIFCLVQYHGLFKIRTVPIADHLCQNTFWNLAHIVPRAGMMRLHAMMLVMNAFVQFQMLGQHFHIWVICHIISICITRLIWFCEFIAVVHGKRHPHQPREIIQTINVTVRTHQVKFNNIRYRNVHRVHNITKTTAPPPKAYKFSLQNEKRHYIMRTALGHSLTVELRTLTPSVLVRIQLPQPRCTTVRIFK